MHCKSILVIMEELFVLRKCILQITWCQSCTLTHFLTNTQVFQVFKINHVFLSNTYESLHIILNPLFSSKYEKNFCFTASASEPLDLLSLYWMSIISFIVYDNKFVVFPNFVIDCNKKTEISKNAGNFSYQHLQFIYHRTNYFHLFWSTYNDIQHNSSMYNYWRWGEWCVWSFLFKELHCNWQFLKNYHPMPTLGQSTWIISQTLSKACTKHVTCISLEQLTESPAAFIMYSMVPVTSNMSNSICLQSLHNFIENICYRMSHCRHFMAWQRKWLPCLPF